jgi:hypothetical protein
VFEWSEGLVGSYSVWVRSEPDLSVSSRIVGTEAIMVKGVVMSGRVASDLVFIA